MGDSPIGKKRDLDDDLVDAVIAFARAAPPMPVESVDGRNRALKESMDGRATAGAGFGFFFGMAIVFLTMIISNYDKDLTLIVMIGVTVFGMVLVVMGGLAAMKNDARIGYRRPGSE